MAQRQRNFLNRRRNNLNQNLIHEEEEERNTQQQEEDQAFRQDRRGFRRSRIPIPIQSRIIDGFPRSNRNNNIEEEFPQDPNEPRPSAGFQYEDDPQPRETENPISARVYRRRDLTDEEFERLGFAKLPPRRNGSR